MQLMSLRLRNVRRFIEPIEITGLTAGVNVLAAPNEHGKSTVFDALHAAFFLSHKSMNAETRGLVPHAGGDPEVDVRFTADGATWRLNKRWSKAQGRRQAKLWRNETLVNQAGEAEDALAALLAPPADGGPAGLLWVRQGLTGLAEKGDEAKARHSLLTSVTGEIDAMTGGRQMDDLLARIHMELTQHLTATGKIRQGGPLHAAADEVAALEESHQRLSDARDALRGALARRAQLRAERRRLEDPEDAARRAQTLAAAKEAMTAGEAHAARLRTAMEAARTARLTAEATVAERARLTAALKEQRDANAAVAKAQSVEADARAGADASATAYESARALRSEAQRFEQAARAIHRSALAAARAKDAAARRAELSQRLTIAETARTAAETAQAAARTGPSDATMSRLRTLQTARDAAQLARERAAPALSIVYAGTGRIRRDGEDLPEGVRLPLPDGGTFDLDGIGRLTLHPGAAADAESVAKAEADLAGTLAQAGYGSVREAEDARQVRVEAEHRVAQARAKLEAAAPDGLDALHAALAALPAHAAPDPALPPVDAAAAAEEAAGDALLEASATYDAARHRNDVARTAHARADAEVTATEGRAARAALALAVFPDPAAALAALETRLQAEETAFAEATRHLERLEERAPDLEALRARHARAEATVEAARSALQTLAIDLRGLDTQIEERASAGIEEELADTADTLAAARHRLAAIQEECAVLQRLADALTSARQAAQEHYLAPVLQELGPLLRMLWPEAALTLDPETLLPHMLTRRETAEPFNILSGGTREQIALLVRLAFARMLARQGRPAPVILDDAIVYADDDRIETLFDALTRQAADLQILVFSCRQRAFRDLGGHMLTLTSAAEDLG